MIVTFSHTQITSSEHASSRLGGGVFARGTWAPFNEYFLSLTTPPQTEMWLAQQISYRNKSSKTFWMQTQVGPRDPQIFRLWDHPCIYVYLYMQCIAQGRKRRSGRL